MKLVHAERNGEAFDSQLVIGVRESYGMLLPHHDRPCIMLCMCHSLVCKCLIDPCHY